jgi:predicted RNase H-like nuclease
MSIEDLFKAVIAALEANTKAVDRLEASLVGRAGGNSKPAKEEKPKAEDAAPIKGDKTAAEQPKPEVKEEAPTKEELQDTVAEMKAEGVEYGTVRELVLKLAPTKREEIKALNAKFGIANLKVLLDKEDDFSTVNDQAKLDAIYAELQKLEA